MERLAGQNRDAYRLALLRNYFDNLNDKDPNKIREQLEMDAKRLGIDITDDSGKPDLNFVGFSLKTKERLFIPPDAEPKKLSPREFDLLYKLALHAGEVVEDKKLMKFIWGSDDLKEYPLLRNELSIVVNRLRKKIGFEYVENAKGVGYKFKTGNETVDSRLFPYINVLSKCESGDGWSIEAEGDETASSNRRLLRRAVEYLGKEVIVFQSGRKVEFVVV